MPADARADGAGAGAWRAEAACGKGVGPEPDDFHSKAYQTAEAAARFCIAYCTVREQCLEEAMRREEGGGGRWGVWGGYTARGRKALALERAAGVLEGAGGTR